MLKKGRVSIYIILVLLSIFILSYFRDSDHLLGATSFIFVILGFHLINTYFKLNFEPKHYAIIILMGAFGMLFSFLYVEYTFYDKILHFIFPILTAILIFYLIQNEKMDLKTKLILTFTTVITIVALAEVAEFILDTLFDLKLQGVFRGDIKGVLKQAGEGTFQMIQSPNTDTMIDLILGFLGVTVFSIYKLFSFKKAPSKK